MDGRRGSVIDIYNWVLENAWVADDRLRDMIGTAPDRRAITILLWAREDRAAFMRDYTRVMKLVQEQEVRRSEFRQRSILRETELEQMIGEIRGK